MMSSNNFLMMMYIIMTKAGDQLSNQKVGDREKELTADNDNKRPIVLIKQPKQVKDS